MRKWQDLAAPDDPGSWLTVSGAWPTNRGTYETSDVYGDSSTFTMTGESGGDSAFSFSTLSGYRSYFFGTDKLWEITDATVTDRTGALTPAGENYHACQYGNITIAARGTAASLISSSGGNFAALAGSPSAKLVCVQSNAVLAFNTSVSADGWAASDVGDYTNWSTGEAASGRILEGKGPITAVVPYGSDVYVFKRDAIFRMTYVGGVVKWQVQKVSEGIGCPALPSFAFGGNPAVSTRHGIFFIGATTDPLSTTAGYKYYLFDGASQPRCVNELTTIRPGIPVYDTHEDMVTVYAYAYESSAANTSVYAYNMTADAWGYIGKISGSSGIGTAFMPLRGDRADIGSSFGAYSALRPLIRAGSRRAVSLATATVSSGNDSTAVFKSHKYGTPNRKTTFKRVTPILRKRTARTGGSAASAALACSFFLERHDTATTTTANPTESTVRDRFDFLVSECYGQFQVTYNNTDVEIDDFLVVQQDAGTD